MTTPGRFCPISPRRPKRRDNHRLRIIKWETGASQSPPPFSSVLVDASVAQKHLIVAGAAAARGRRAIRGVETGGERNRGVVIEAAPRANGDRVAAIVTNSDLAGIALPSAVALVERPSERRRCDAHRRQHGNDGK